MPLHFSAAHSSRVNKRKSSNPLLRRSSSSPFTSFNQRKPVQRSKSKPETSEREDDLFDEKLEEIGLVPSLASDLLLRDVAQVMQYAQDHMFDPLPEAGGLNSTRIAELLNFRKSLPRTVSVTHIHALITSPTAAEKEISELMRACVLKKIVIPGRGTGGSDVSEGLILLSDLEKLLDQTDVVNEALRANFLAHLRAFPLARGVSSSAFSAQETTTLMRAGFLTSIAHAMSSTNRAALPTDSSTSIPSIARAASGSMAAVGGEGVVVEAGVSGGTSTSRRPSSQSTQSQKQTSKPQARAAEFQLALPNMGQYLRLLTEARSHLMSLVLKTKYREMPLYLLRERWDGGISADDPAAKAKKYRGEFAGVLPAQTRKWRFYHGLAFDWVLAECVGAGLLELFETGSVGRAARAI